MTEISLEQQSKFNDYLDRIGRACRSVKESFYELGALLDSARKELPSNDYDKILVQVKIGARTAERLIRVANDNRLSDPDIQKLLPP